METYCCVQQVNERLRRVLMKWQVMCPSRYLAVLDLVGSGLGLPVSHVILKIELTTDKLMN